MIRVALLKILVWFTMVTCGLSQATEIVTLRMPQEVHLYGGESTEIRIIVGIKDGFHLQANPVNDDFLIPTTVEIKSAGEIIAGTPVYPPGTLFTLKDSPDTLWVYDGMFSINFPVQVSPDARLGTYRLEGEFYYQACDSVRCFAPRSISFTVSVRVVKK